ncbi:MAG: DUF4352 domain-containing protein [Butyrivibrio sp.]|nr:DUF4352 domain-containing protein [Butyrivibrio sp.]
MKCPKCGADAGEAKFCSNCGANLQQEQPLQQQTSPNNTVYVNGISNGIPSYANATQGYSIKKKNSGMGIAAFVLSFLGPIAIVGMLLGIIDMIKDKQKANKHGFSIAALVIGCLMLVGLYGLDDSSSTSDNKVASNSAVEEIKEDMDNTVVAANVKNATDTEEVEEEKKDSPDKLRIGDEFRNKTISGVVTYADLDYKNYNDIWTEVENGYKAVYIKIKVTNISKKSNYVSVGDFKCYVDNVVTDAEIISGGNEDYNANIDPGRSALLGALYIVPENEKTIELEYQPLGERADRQIIVIQDETTTETILGISEENVKSAGGSVSDDVNVIGVGDEFGNKTITGVVTDVDLDYKGYNTYWTKLGADQKAIHMNIKLTNISNESNYVSVGDFRCYVDGVITDAEMLGGENDEYNANIDPDRSAILGAMYIIPKDVESIELEYSPIGEKAKRVIIKIQ